MKFTSVFILALVLIPQVLFAQQDPRIMDPTPHNPVPTPIPYQLPTSVNTVTPVAKPATPEFDPKSIVVKKLDTHLLVNENGVGDQCKAGDNLPTEWKLDPDIAIDSKEKIVAVIQNAAAHDTRLRSVTILDDQIDMYYLQPAQKWGFLSTNYYLHVSANGDSFRLSLEKPKWIDKSNSQHEKATTAFSTYIPQYFDDTTVASYKDVDLIARDAKMIEVISAVMYQVEVMPISNSFFVCYIMPFFIYILVILVLVSVGLWFLIRKLRRGTGFLVKKIHPVKLGGEDDDEDKHLGDEHVTHFKLPKQ